MLLLSPNPLALQKWEWQNICIPQAQWGDAPQGDGSSPGHARPASSLSASIVGAAGVQHWEGAEASARDLHGKFRLGAETGEELGTR